MGLLHDSTPYTRLFRQKAARLIPSLHAAVLEEYPSLALGMLAIGALEGRSPEMATQRNSESMNSEGAGI